MPDQYGKGNGKCGSKGKEREKVTPREKARAKVVPRAKAIVRVEKARARVAECYLARTAPSTGVSSSKTI
jgi:hypothetical protein